MSKTQEQISAALRDAIQAGDESRVVPLRLVLTAIKKKEKETHYPLGDLDLVSIINSQIEQRRESIEQYRKAGREDLAREEENELQILQGYI